jgi:hypothetical protein
MNYFSIQPEWAGERAFILGGGPSIADFDPDTIRGKGRVIAVNTAGLDIMPDADVLFAADGRWFQWNADRLHLNRSQYRICRQMPPADILPWPLLQVKHDRTHGMSLEPDTVSGSCGGAMATCLAFHFGAAEIVWVGFDMKPGNYHDTHKHSTPPHFYERDFMPALRHVVKGIRAQGRRVINATPGSAFDGAPIMALEEVLS